MCEIPRNSEENINLNARRRYAALPNFGFIVRRSIHLSYGRKSECCILNERILFKPEIVSPSPISRLFRPGSCRGLDRLPHSEAGAEIPP